MTEVGEDLVGRRWHTRSRRAATIPRSGSRTADGQRCAARARCPRRRRRGLRSHSGPRKRRSAPKRTSRTWLDSDRSGGSLLNARTQPIPARAAAAAVERAWLLCSPPAVTRTSHPRAMASATRSSSFRALFATGGEPGAVVALDPEAASWKSERRPEAIGPLQGCRQVGKDQISHGLRSHPPRALTFSHRTDRRYPVARQGRSPRTGSSRGAGSMQPRSRPYLGTDVTRWSL